MNRCKIQIRKPTRHTHTHTPTVLSVVSGRLSSGECNFERSRTATDEHVPGMCEHLCARGRLGAHLIRKIIPPGKDGGTQRRCFGRARSGTVNNSARPSHRAKHHPSIHPTQSAHSHTHKPPRRSVLCFTLGPAMFERSRARMRPV